MRSAKLATASCLRAIAELRVSVAKVRHHYNDPFACDTADWLDETNAWSDNPVGAFDFPLRWRLQDLCDTYGFSLRHLVEGGVLALDRPARLSPSWSGKR